MAKKNGITVVMSLHEIDLAQKIADKVLCVKGDTIDRFDAPENIFREEEIRALYDIGEGFYDPLFGSVELGRPEGTPQTFVFSSSGNGIPVFRALQREDIPFYAGILYTNDVDYRLARLLAAEVVCEAPFHPIGDAAYEQALRALKKCTRAIDAGVEIGPGNRRLEELLREAASMGILSTGKRMKSPPVKALRFGRVDLLPLRADQHRREVRFQRFGAQLIERADGLSRHTQVAHRKRIALSRRFDNVRQRAPGLHDHHRPSGNISPSRNPDRWSAADALRPAARPARHRSRAHRRHAGDDFASVFLRNPTIKIARAGVEGGITQHRIGNFEPPLQLFNQYARRRLVSRVPFPARPHGNAQMGDRFSFDIGFDNAQRDALAGAESATAISSASPSARTAANVKSDGSPGPTPTKDNNMAPSGCAQRPPFSIILPSSAKPCQRIHAIRHVQSHKNTAFFGYYISIDRKKQGLGETPPPSEEAGAPALPNFDKFFGRPR